MIVVLVQAVGLMAVAIMFGLVVRLIEGRRDAKIAEREIRRLAQAEDDQEAYRLFRQEERARRKPPPKPTAANLRRQGYTIVDQEEVPF